MAAIYVYNTWLSTFHYWLATIGRPLRLRLRVNIQILFLFRQIDVETIRAVVRHYIGSKYLYVQCIYIYIYTYAHTYLHIRATWASYSFAFCVTQEPRLSPELISIKLSCLLQLRSTRSVHGIASWNPNFGEKNANVTRILERT